MKSEEAYVLDTSARYSRMRMYVECRCIEHVMYLPQSAWTRMEHHTVPQTASNTLNITGMPGEVRAHGVPCHFPSCPISLLSCPVACSLKSQRKEPAHEAVLLQ